MLRAHQQVTLRGLRIRPASYLLIASLLLLPAAALAQNRTTELENRVQTLEKKVEVLRLMVLQLTMQRDRPDSVGVATRRSPDHRNWEGLRVGMSEDSVRSLLGAPSRFQMLSSLSYWYYEGGTAYIRPHVVFENDNHLVYGWVSP